MSGAKNSRGTQVIVLLFVVMVGAAVLIRVAAHPAPSPILMTIPLRLNTHAEVDVALDARRSRLFIVNASVVQTFDTRTGALVHSVGTGTVYAPTVTLRGLGRVP